MDFLWTKSIFLVFFMYYEVSSLDGGVNMAPSGFRVLHKNYSFAILRVNYPRNQWLWGSWLRDVGNVHI